MKETPITYSPDMLKARDDGRKLMTRRVCKELTDRQKAGGWLGAHSFEHCGNANWWGIQSGVGLGPFKCPYGKVGDKLYIKEGYQITEFKAEWCSKLVRVIGNYLSDNQEFKVLLSAEESQKFLERKKPYARTPGMFMYKSLARKWDVITDIRLEPVQDISADDALKEGLHREWDGTHMWYAGSPKENMSRSTIIAFRRLWDSINKKRGYEWEINPYVWAITYRKDENA